jgi:glycosyltransferase involved in cell wall biosynthesis
MSGKAALRAAPRQGIPVIHTFHALGVVKRRFQGARDTSPPERLALEQRIARTVDHIVATCTDEVFELVRLRADRRRISVIPCGVDLELFRPDGPAEARDRARFRVVVVSRLVERKGIEDVIRALSRLPDTELIIAGGPDRAQLWDDPEACRLRAIVEELDLEERVHFRGGLARSAVPPLLRSADAVVSVPWYEPFGIVPVEAMACGVPVVGAAVGGLVDTVVDGLTGVHVKPREPDQLARVLADLLPDDDLRRAMGQAGAQRARAKYGHDQVAQATLETYRRLLDEWQAEPLRVAR